MRVVKEGFLEEVTFQLHDLKDQREPAKGRPRGPESEKSSGTEISASGARAEWRKVARPESGEVGVSRSCKALSPPGECIWGSHRITFLSLPPLHSDLPS